ncbi:MAG: sugar phosphate isomerase/epimerase [Clostridiales bacterium]|jgi:sugar phosphate isomerase/epimerase|nr:sugar phosphate isomerase/epimerase [Clostridiales bacterium]
MKFPIAVQLYSVRDDMEKDFEGTIKKVKALGYDGVEFAGLFGKDPAWVKQLLAENGLVPVSAHVPYYDMLENPEKTLSDYKTIGCEYVAVPYLTPECRPGTEGFSATVAGVEKIARAAKAMGMKLLYHNHDFEFVKLDGKYALDVLYDTVPADLLETEIDTCWVNVAGVNPAEYIEKYSGRAPVVHLKDFYKSGSGTGGQLYKLIGIDDDEQQGESTFEFRPVGFGMQDFPLILSSSEKAGAKWVVVEQDNPSMGKTPMESIEMSINYLRAL